MKEQLDSEQIKEHLNRICSDDLFAKSPNSIRILNYLVEQALAGNDISEYTIGMDLFEQNYSADKNDGTIRVYMYKIRKKLDKYYSLNGKNDELIFSIDKGSYNLKFIVNEAKIEQSDELNKSVKISKKYLYLGAVLLFIGVCLFVFRNSFVPQENYCWRAFFEKEANNMCILADQMVLHKSMAIVNIT